MKDELGGEIKTNFAGLRAKIYNYLIDDGSEDQKAKDTKKFFIKKLKFENYKNYLEATRLENNINHLEKNKINIDSLKTIYEKFIRNKKPIIKTQKRLKNERQNVFTEDINKFELISNDMKRMQSIDLIETYGYGTGEDLVSEKEEIKSNNTIKRHKKLLTLMMLKKRI